MAKLPTKADCQKAEKIAASLAADSYPHARVIRAEVNAGPDLEGDPVLWIRVVVDDPDGKLADADADTKFNFKRELSNELEGIGLTVDSVITYALYGEVANVA